MQKCICCDHNEKRFDLMLFPHIHTLYTYVCAVFCLFLFSFLFLYMCVCPLCPSHSDLHCPVVCGSSGLLLFSCSSRYLFHHLVPRAFQLFSFLSGISVPLTPKLSDARQAAKKYIYCICVKQTDKHLHLCRCI